jgi:hypothetical protein
MLKDVTSLHRSETALRMIAEGWRGNSRGDFFQQLVLRLSQLFNADLALVGLEDPQSAGVIQTAAFCLEGRIVENLRYDVAETPCEQARTTGACIYPRNVRQHFPNDEMLMEIGAESYLGAPLRDSRGQLLGHLAMVNRQPVEDVERAMDILIVLADRAGVELERLQAEEDL